MFNNKTEYALNKKNPLAIAYQDAYGNIIRLTEADFESTEEFQHWKALLDDSSHAEEKTEHVHQNHTISSTGFEEYIESIPAWDGSGARHRAYTDKRRSDTNTVSQALDVCG